MRAARITKKHPSESRAKRIVLLIHGIRTRATWAEKVRKTIESRAGFQVQPVKYGFVNTVRFIFPFLTRQSIIDRFVDEYRAAKLRNPDARISVIAHSFGTYVVTKALARATDVVLERVILCGSVVAESFRTAPYRAQLGDKPILNECGTNDIWPLLAKSAAWGYGATGTFGFGSDGIRDRFHNFSHSSYFTEEFVRDYWLPYLAEGKLDTTEWDLTRPNPPYWHSVITMLPIKWLAAIALAAMAFWYFVGGYSSSPIAKIDQQILVGHWMGVSQAYIRLHIENKNFSDNQFIVWQAFLTSPAGDVTQLYVERVTNCNGMVPVSPYLALSPYAKTQCEYELLGDMSHLVAANREIDRIAFERNIMTLLPDNNRNIIDGQLVSDLQRAAEKMIWKPGKWRLTVEFKAGPKSGSNLASGQTSGTFDLREADMQSFRNSPVQYRTGIGVFRIWRYIAPNQMVTVGVQDAT
jgi:pimeloyl-ACP methyl ester carboxylesterase